MSSRDESRIMLRVQLRDMCYSIYESMNMEVDALKQEISRQLEEALDPENLDKTLSEEVKKQLGAAIRIEVQKQVYAKTREIEDLVSLAMSREVVSG